MIAEHTTSGAVLRRYVHGARERRRALLKRGDEPILDFALHDAALSPPERRRLCHGYEGASLSTRKYYQTDNQGSVTVDE